MITGQFTGNIPIIRVTVGWKESTQDPFAVLDTGFTGDLQLTPQMALDLGLEVKGVMNMKTANGQIFSVPTARAEASMEGIKNSIEVLISESMPLVGISFLSKFGYKAIIDCKYRTVNLEKVI